MSLKCVFLFMVIVLFFLSSVNVVLAESFTLVPIGVYKTNVFDNGTAEIVSFDPKTQRIFVMNAGSSTVDALKITDPTKPILEFSIDINSEINSGGINSIDVANNILAIAVQNKDPLLEGFVIFYDTDGNLVNIVTTGFGPDALHFFHHGKKLVVANEGEPVESVSGNLVVDPPDSISIIDLSLNPTKPTVHTLDFLSFDKNTLQLLSKGIKIQNGVLPSIDFEPEYSAVSPDNKQAFITLQEANAFAIVDLTVPKVTDIIPLGFKDHSLEQNAIDTSDRDNEIRIKNWPIFGMYQPDAIDSYQIDEMIFYVTANEGAPRDYQYFSEEVRVMNLILDEKAFSNIPTLQQKENLGRLKVTNTMGDIDGDGDFDKLYSFGTRSFSIWNSTGNLIYDSGDEFERITAERLPNYFNSDNNDNDSFDKRSDNRGPEPEGIEIGYVNSKILSFVGLEKVGGIMVYDITNPFDVKFLDYVNTRDFGVPVHRENGSTNPDVGDLGPEGIHFISSETSPIDSPLLVVGNDLSGSVTIYEVKHLQEPTEQQLPNSSQIPAWIKNNAGWWANGEIDDTSFIQGIQFLIIEGIVKINP